MSYNVANLPRMSVPAITNDRSSEQTGKLGSKEVKRISAKDVLKGGNKGVKTGGGSRDTTFAIILLCIIFAPVAIPLFILYALATADISSHRGHHHRRYHHGCHSHSYHHHRRW